MTMPAAIPQTPAPKAAETKNPTQPKRLARDESFKKVLNGAKRQVKAKQHPTEAELPTAPTQPAEPAVSDDALLKTEPTGTDQQLTATSQVDSAVAVAPEDSSELDEDVAQQGEGSVVAIVAPVAPAQTPVEPVSDEIVPEEGIDWAGMAERSTTEMPRVEQSFQFTEPPVESASAEPNVSDQAEISLNLTPAAEDAAVDGGPISLSQIEGGDTGEGQAQSINVAETSAAPTIPLQKKTAATDDDSRRILSQATMPTDTTARPTDFEPAEKAEAFGTPSGAVEMQSVAPRALTSDASDDNPALQDSAHSEDAAVALFSNQKMGPSAPVKFALPIVPVADPVEARFAEMNHPRILTAVQSELMAHGGTVRLRLDPPELGALQVRIDVRDGVLAASFQTSNDEATRLLTQSLQQLKTTLESQGLTVEKLQVHQTARQHFDGQRGGDDRREQQSPHQWQQQEQQRREVLQRMWRRVRDGRDPFDLVA
jgi:flagellar hook-length control protein FliK